MSDTESHEEGSSSENEGPVNFENATRHAETRDESAIDHVKKSYDKGDIIPVTEGDGESPIKKKPWNFEEEKENTMTLKRIRFEAIPEEVFLRKSQMKWQSMPRNILKSMSVAKN